VSAHDLNITLLQTDRVWQGPADNRAAFGKLTSKYAGSSDLIVLPELVTNGFTMNPTEHSEAPNGATSVRLSQQAREQAVTPCGSLIIRDHQYYFNRLLWVTPDGTTAHYDKRHLFRMAGEDQHYAKNDTTLEKAAEILCKI